MFSPEWVAIVPFLIVGVEKNEEEDV